MRILIVDDDHNGLLMLEAMLKGFGHEVMAAENGEIALELARVTPLSLLSAISSCRLWMAMSSAGSGKETAN